MTSVQITAKRDQLLEPLPDTAFNNFPKRETAEHWLAKTVTDINDGTYQEIAPILFWAFAARWLTTTPGLKPSTRSAYQSVITRQLIPAFGDTFIHALTAADVNSYLVRAERAELKPKTRRNVLVLLHRILEDARDARHTKTNPLRDRRGAVRRPTASRASSTSRALPSQTRRAPRPRPSAAPSSAPARSRRSSPRAPPPTRSRST